MTHPTDAPAPAALPVPDPELLALVPETLEGPDVEPVRPRRWLAAMFATYLVLLVWLVLWKVEVPWVGSPSERGVKLVPFVATATFGPSQPSEVLANLLLFVPFGLYLGLLARSWPWWRSAALVAAVSVGLETTEYVIAVGRTDVTDVIVNTAGGLVGLAIVALARRVARERADVFVARACTVLTLLALLAAAVIAVSPLQYGSPPGPGRGGPAGHLAPGGPPPLDPRG